MGPEILSLAFTSGWASGINAYATLLVLGFADRWFQLSQIPDALARTDVMVAAGVMFAIELVADKIPYLDSLWDSVHTVIRPLIGATAGYLIGHDGSTLDAAFTAATGGITALASHTVKASLRVAVNTSPEPMSNIAVSSVEDLSVIGVMAIAVEHPYIAATIAAILLILGTWLVTKLWRRIRAYKRRYDAWGERVGLARGKTIPEPFELDTGETGARPDRWRSVDPPKE